MAARYIYIGEKKDKNEKKRYLINDPPVKRVWFFIRKQHDWYCEDPDAAGTWLKYFDHDEEIPYHFNGAR